MILWKRTVVTLFICVMFMFSNVGKSQISSNDLDLKQTGQYQVNGVDPYLIFNARQTLESSNYLLIDLGQEITGVPLELFFKSVDDLFDPYYKLQLTAESFPAAIKLPQNIDVVDSTRLRLDINQCPNCIVRFDALPLLTNEVEQASIIVPNTVLNGITTLESSPEPISKNGWQLNDINGSLDSFVISGADPYMVSPRLITSTRHLAGVYIRLQAPQSDKPWNDVQVFYQTEKHSFSQDATLNLRLPENQQNSLEFVVPLEFLSKEHPSNSILERLRFDLPEISGEWSLLEARLIHEDQAMDTVQHIPTKIVQFKRQTSSGIWALLKKSLENVVSDLGFTISYLLLLIFVGLYFIRLYRSYR